MPILCTDHSFRVEISANENLLDEELNGLMEWKTSANTTTLDEDFEDAALLNEAFGNASVRNKDLKAKRKIRSSGAENISILPERITCVLDTLASDVDTLDSNQTLGLDSFLRLDLQFSAFQILKFSDLLEDIMSAVYTGTLYIFPKGKLMAMTLRA